MITVLVCGGRDYADKATVNKVLDRLYRDNPIRSIVHGACGWDAGTPDLQTPGNLRGADALADDWANDHGVTVIRHPAWWKARGPAAGPERNVDMLLDHPIHLGVCFPGGKGTADMLKRLHHRHIPVITITQ